MFLVCCNFVWLTGLFQVNRLSLLTWHVGFNVTCWFQLRWRCSSLNKKKCWRRYLYIEKNIYTFKNLCKHFKIYLYIWKCIDVILDLWGGGDYSFGWVLVEIYNHNRKQTVITFSAFLACLGGMLSSLLSLIICDVGMLSCNGWD